MGYKLTAVTEIDMLLDRYEAMSEEEYVDLLLLVTDYCREIGLQRIDSAGGE